MSSESCQTFAVGKDNGFEFSGKPFELGPPPTTDARTPLGRGRGLQPSFT